MSYTTFHLNPDKPLDYTMFIPDSGHTSVEEARRRNVFAEVEYLRVYDERVSEFIHVICRCTETTGRQFHIVQPRWHYIWYYPNNIHVFYTVDPAGHAVAIGWQWHCVMLWYCTLDPFHKGQFWFDGPLEPMATFNPAAGDGCPHYLA